MTRKKVEAVITDCARCPHFSWRGSDGRMPVCTKGAKVKVLPDMWIVNTGSRGGYIPEWCPLEDAPCGTRGGNATRPCHACQPIDVSAIMPTEED